MSENFDAELPAFPNPVGAQGVVRCTLGNEGLTKRELFAALAMAGLVVRWTTEQACDHHAIALHAVRQADALLTALNAPQHEIYEGPDDA